MADAAAASYASIPKGWQALMKKAADKIVVLGRDGALLDSTQLLTYAGFFDFSVKKVANKTGEEMPNLFAECHAPTLTGKQCDALAIQLTYKGRADLEGTNLMNHLRSHHMFIVNFAHRTETKAEKEAREREQAQTLLFTRTEVANEKKYIIELIATSGKPLAMFSASSLSWEAYCSVHHIPCIPRTTLRDAFHEQLATLVKIPNDKHKLLLDTPFVLGDFSLLNMYAVGTDVYTAESGQSKVSVNVFFAAETTVFGLKNELRPLSWPIGLDTFDKTEVELVDEQGEVRIYTHAGDHSSANLADIILKNVKKLRLSGAQNGMPRMLESMTDTASNALGTGGAESLAHCGIVVLEKDGGKPYGPRRGECVAHKKDLAAEDLPKRVPAFRELLELCRKIVIFFKNEKHWELLLSELRRLGLSLRKLIVHGETRFFTMLLSLKQITDISEAIVAIVPEAVKEVLQRIQLRTMQKELLENIDSARLLVSAFNYSMRFTPRMGSQNAFTGSLELLLFANEWENIKTHEAKELAARTASDGTVGEITLAGEVLQAYKEATFQRCAPIEYFYLPSKPPGCMMPKGVALELRRVRDRSLQGKMLVDPAISKKIFDDLGCSENHGYAMLITVLKTGIMHSILLADDSPKVADEDSGEFSSDDGGGGARAAAPAPKKPKLAKPKPAGASSTFATYEAEKAYIKLQTRTEFQSEETFQLKQTESLRDAAARWKKGAKGTRSNTTMPDDEAEYSNWAEKMAKKVLDEETADFVKMRADFGSRYGDPFAPYSYTDDEGKLVEVHEERKRYSFWPSVKDKLPGHYYAAAVLLGMPATSVANESIHSIAAYVMNKLRSRLTSANHEALTLAKIMLERSLKEKKLVKILELEHFVKLNGYVDVSGMAEAFDDEESV